MQQTRQRATARAGDLETDVRELLGSLGDAGDACREPLLAALARLTADVESKTGLMTSHALSTVDGAGAATDAHTTGDAEMARNARSGSDGADLPECARLGRGSLLGRDGLLGRGGR